MPKTRSHMTVREREERQAAKYWKKQEKLPLRERSSLWWVTKISSTAFYLAVCFVIFALSVTLFPIEF